LYDQYQSTQGKPIKEEDKNGGVKAKLEMKVEEKDGEMKEENVDSDIKEEQVDVMKKPLDTEHKLIDIRQEQVDVKKELGDKDE